MAQRYADNKSEAMLSCNNDVDATITTTSYLAGGFDLSHHTPLTALSKASPLNMASPDKVNCDKTKVSAREADAANLIVHDSPQGPLGPQLVS